MSGGPTLLAFDFDGTIAPICDDPGEARLARGAAELLAEATRMRGVAVAISSGRDLDDLQRRTRVRDVYLVGSHGLDIVAPGGLPVRNAPPLDVPLQPSIESEATAAGYLVERKKHGVALHWRTRGAGSDEHLARQFRDWAAGAGLELVEGRCVVEARRPGPGKEEALRWLASAIGAARVIYAGDDLTDFGALRFAAERGRGVFVASSEREAPPGVTVVDSFRALFHLVREEILI